QASAILEAIHVLLGWVRSSLSTTAMQVASRLYAIWGITEPFQCVSSNSRSLCHVHAHDCSEMKRPRSRERCKSELICYKEDRVVVETLSAPYST
ncbi:hypothetical protein DFS33DRAFT_1254235, partial [Desarmillaria ectypa]